MVFRYLVSDIGRHFLRQTEYWLGCCFFRSTSLMENREVLSSCEVEFAGPAPGPRIDWHFGNVTYHGPVGAPKKRWDATEVNDVLNVEHNNNDACFRSTTHSLIFNWRTHFLIFNWLSYFRSVFWPVSCSFLFLFMCCWLFLCLFFVRFSFGTWLFYLAPNLRSHKNSISPLTVLLPFTRTALSWWLVKSTVLRYSAPSFTTIGIILFQNRNASFLNFSTLPTSRD